MSAHFCTACGAPLAADVHFCTACGAPVGSDGGTPAPPPSDAPPPPGALPPAAPPPPNPLPSSAPPTSTGGRRNLVIIGVLAVLLLVAGVVAVIALTGEEASADVALEPIGVEVPDPFTATVALGEEQLPATTTTTASSTTSASSTSAAPRPGAAGGAVSGSAPGLYGGTRDTGSCDPEKLIAFLTNEPEKAAAWAAVQGIDAAEIPSFVRKLTPVVLRRDTRVLNHGYRNGKATPRPAVLQAGTAVLVDDFGIPRVKCGCGNPLAEPRPITSGTRYTGTAWNGFRPANVVVVRQDVRVDVFVLVDVRTGDPFRRPTASKGDDDAPATPGTAASTTSTSSTTEPVTTTTGDASGSEGTAAPVLFEIASIAGVSNGPTAPSVADLPAARITAISTYHWNNATGATPGTIGLRAEDGTMYGPFPTTGSPGQGGVPNASWTAITDFEVPAGRYTVVDSSPETWAWAPDTGGRGMVTIHGR